jgi:hypothetical protein
MWASNSMLSPFRMARGTPVNSSQKKSRTSFRLVGSNLLISTASSLFIANNGATYDIEVTHGASSVLDTLAGYVLIHLPEVLFSSAGIGLENMNLYQELLKSEVNPQDTVLNPSTFTIRE